MALRIVFLIFFLAYIFKEEPKKKIDLVVKLQYPVGKIRGHQLISHRGYAVYSFQDIPFAKPPIGEYRFKLPQKLDGWDGILNTQKNNKICPQNGENPSTNEDCLVLSVYTPKVPGSEVSLPVYFWIHGGEFMTGSGSESLYNPKFFASFDMVIVTTNYRLGVLGFLTTDDEHIPGNLGLKDQQFALKWVHLNIHLFGGDPRRITIGGENAGASSVSYHMLSNLNRGLFRGAIQESGSALNDFALQRNSKENAFKFGTYLHPSFNSTNSNDLLKSLQEADVEDILFAQIKMESSERVGFVKGAIWKPIVERSAYPGAIVIGESEQKFVDGKYNKVPTLIGFNSEESLSFLNDLTKQEYEECANDYDDDPSIMISSKYNVIPENKVSTAIELKALYTQIPFAQNKSGFIRYTSDAGFIHPVIRQAQLTSRNAPTYLYQLSYGPAGINITGTHGVGHATDLMYFWNTPILPRPVDEYYQILLVMLWKNFIIYQNPTPIRYVGLHRIIWPVTDYDTLQYLDLNEPSSLATNPRQFQEVKEVLDKCVIQPSTVV